MSKHFYSEYGVLNKLTEIPDVFTTWCSISAVSCALGRRVWIDMGAFKIYPNMFIILIAGSGRMRKSTAIGVTRDLLDLVSPPFNLIAQKLTPEALIDAMKQSPVSHDGKTISLSEPIGQGFACTDELTNFLNRSSNDGGIVPMLIELYDCRNRFSYRTKSRGNEVLRDTQLGLLAATTPEELRKAIPEEVIGSGLASRILFIYESNPGTPVAFPTYSPTQLLAKEFCIRSLSRICSIPEGPIVISKSVREWCDVCYRERCWRSPLLEDPHLRGYASRRYIHILKLAICLSVGYFEQPDITVEVLTRAEELIKINEVNLQRVVQLVTMNEKGSVIATVLAYIEKHRTVARFELIKAMAHRLDSREVTEVMETLKSSNQVMMFSKGTDIFYKIRD